MGDSEFAEVLDAIREQWTAMAGMAAMFTTSILIGVFIQPLYNFDEARAFGEEGASKASNIFLELAIILVFTVTIIWLARKGLEFVIKGIVFFALWFSLFYAIQPFVLILAWFIDFASGGGISYDSLAVFWLVGALGISTALMYILYRYPEWYVINTVGVLVGAGVITLIGIAFVPVLIILFMVMAAIYDHWAVNKSKHMLELADTMIGLKLPVLLVAPKQSGYTFIDQEGDVMRRGEPSGEGGGGSPSTYEPVPKAGSKGRDALFMGLGDVIFPGMLVISSITFLPEVGPVVFDFWGDPTLPVHLGPMLVGMGTLAGSLVGYMALMTQVARGKPQAGLPLLNGGSILGYLLSGALALGIDQLWQDITFL
jgi:presenilin-like A22 family membrane protease